MLEASRSGALKPAIPSILTDDGLTEVICGPEVRFEEALVSGLLEPRLARGTKAFLALAVVYHKLALPGARKPLVRILNLLSCFVFCAA